MTKLIIFGIESDKNYLKHKEKPEVNTIFHGKNFWLYIFVVITSAKGGNQQ